MVHDNETNSVFSEILAKHVLRILARLQMDGRNASLGDLVDELDVRRGDIRRAVSMLHEQGFLDALRMRLTMAGFAIGAGLIDKELPPVRQSASASSCSGKLHAA